MIRAIHKTLGPGVLEKLYKDLHPDFPDESYVYFRPDEQKAGNAAVMLVDKEALKYGTP